MRRAITNGRYIPKADANNKEMPRRLGIVERGIGTAGRVRSVKAISISRTSFIVQNRQVGQSLLGICPLYPDRGHFFAVEVSLLNLLEIIRMQLPHDV